MKLNLIELHMYIYWMNKGKAVFSYYVEASVRLFVISNFLMLSLLSLFFYRFKHKTLSLVSSVDSALHFSFSIYFFFYYQISKAVKPLITVNSNIDFNLMVLLQYPKCCYYLQTCRLAYVQLRNRNWPKSI